MNIAIIGAGAMGSVYGGILSKANTVSLIDTNADTVSKINNEGLVLQNEEGSQTYHPGAYTSSETLEPVDLVIIFVKSLFIDAALSSNRSLIDENTYVLTLQNGFGHEDVIGKYVDSYHIIIGTTEDNGAVLSPGVIRFGGNRRTNIGLLNGETTEDLLHVKRAFEKSGFICTIYDNIQQLRWNKLFTNASLSVVTALLQVPIGYIHENKHAWALTSQLVHEAVQVAHSYDIVADEEKILDDIKNVSLNSPDGVTSICADIKNGRKTEVDFISGALVKAAEKHNINVPSHKFALEMIHGLEDRTN
ncbi:MAG TPA: ketopantoate reductase family protein [Candidatus Pelethocola excrementipullorum]|nr:ketopantoate reductase family protein [Candidatus Pelethocola excrementipullorum]